MSIKPLSIPPKTLYQSILSTSSSFVLNDIKSWDGVTNLVAGDFGSQAFGAFINATRTQIEFFEFDPATIASSSITILNRGLGFSGSQTPVAAYKLDWTANETTVLLGSDVPQYMALLARLTNDNAFTGVNTVPTPVGPTEIANRAFVENTAVSGAADASTTVKGLGRSSSSPNGTVTALTSISNASPAVCTLNSHGLTLNDSIIFTTSGSLPTGLSLATTYYVISAGLTANAFQVSLTLGGTAINTSSAGSGTHSFAKTTPVFIGQYDYRLNPNNYAADAGANDTYVITLTNAPTAYVTGQVFYFKANTVNTGACTLNVNGLGAKSLKMNSGLDPVDGYIKALQIVGVIYDGTNFQIFSVSGKPSVSQTGEETYIADTSASSTAYVATLVPAVVAYVTGMVIRVKMINANTTTTPTLNVNGLGAKTIVKLVSTALAVGDIAANMYCTFIYDGTNFVLQNPVANITVYKNGVTTKGLSDSSTTQNIAHGGGAVPKFVEIVISTWLDTSNTNPVNMSITFYNGTLQSSVYWGGRINTATTSSQNGAGTSVIVGENGNYQSGVVTFDATNIIITWTKTGTPGNTAQIAWKAIF